MKTCLGQFWKTFSEFLRGKIIPDSFPNAQVSLDEPLCRFILSKSHFSIKNLLVKHAAFMPAPNKTTSVFRISGMSEVEIWDLGEKVVSKALEEKTIYGFGQIFPKHIAKIGLLLDPNNIPPRHADIVNWPDEKSEQKLRAMELAKEANFFPSKLLNSA